MNNRSFLLLAAIAGMMISTGTVLATRLWTPAEFEAFERSRPYELTAQPDYLPAGPRRHNYLERIKLIADFVTLHQVDDPVSSDFGGIREAEHMPDVIETDNTQEAIWVWSRWYELTGRDDYAENIRRAWHYVMNFPAYWEHNGNPEHTWYAVWNCGLAFMAESRYRAAYGDTSFRAYADSSRGFYLRNPLPQTGFRDNFVVAQSSGMAYAYALETGDQELRDTALVRGARVRDWIEEDAANRLGYTQWAMCGGTAFWGVVNTLGREDTSYGRQWVNIYADSLPGFHPTGNWNCSHNIWLANAYRAAAEVGGDIRHWRMHQYLLDTLLTRDTNRSGGIPATWNDPPGRDQTWVSTYLHFMALDVYTTPTPEYDAAQLEFVMPVPERLFIAPDSADVLVPVANVGLEVIRSVTTNVTGKDYRSGLTMRSIPFLAFDTLVLDRMNLPEPGHYSLKAVTTAPDDMNPANDTTRVEFKVYGMRAVEGSLTDSVTGEPVPGWLYARITGDPTVWDSCRLDPAGSFNLSIIDTTITISVRPEAPYYNRSWNFEITGDTTFNLVTATAQVMLVNNDPSANYRHFYTNALDAVGVTWTGWSRPDSGMPPWHLVEDLRSPTVIYYSGDATTGTIAPEDRDSLVAMGSTGFNLLLTGQNIAEELAGTAFLEDFCGVRLDSSGWRQPFVFGNRDDSVGIAFNAFATVGGDGANNQLSRDVLSPADSDAAVLLVYDTLSNVGAGIRRLDPATGTRIITLGFGFEAANRPSSRPDFNNRPELMERLLSWFDIPTGVSEPGPGPVRMMALWASPNPFRNLIRLESSLPTGTRLRVRDVTGRLVDELTLERPAQPTSETGPTVRVSAATWSSQALPAGVYFVTAPGYPEAALRIVKLR